MKIVLVVLALLMVIATALPLLRFDQWWIRVFDFLGRQITIAGIVLLAPYLYFRQTQRVYESVVLGLLVLAVGYQVVKMFPCTVLMPKQPSQRYKPQVDAHRYQIDGSVDSART